MQRKTSDHIENKVCRRIIFVRHGETDWLRDDIQKGEQNLSLNSRGRKQVIKTAKYLKKILKDCPNAVMVSSSLARAVDTADIIKIITGIPISEKLDGLNEFYDYGKVKNLSNIPSNAESLEKFQARVEKTINILLSTYHQADPLIIASHHNVFKYLAKYLAQQQPSDLKNAEAVNFSLNEKGQWELEILDINKLEVEISDLLMQNLFGKSENKIDQNENQDKKEILQHPSLVGS